MGHAPPVLRAVSTIRSRSWVCFPFFQREPPGLAPVGLEIRFVGLGPIPVGNKFGSSFGENPHDRK